MLPHPSLTNKRCPIIPGVIGVRKKVWASHQLIQTSYVHCADVSFPQQQRRCVKMQRRCCGLTDSKEMTGENWRKILDKHTAICIPCGKEDVHVKTQDYNRPRTVAAGESCALPGVQTYRRVSLRKSVSSRTYALTLDRGHRRRRQTPRQRSTHTPTALALPQPADHHFCFSLK